MSITVYRASAGSGKTYTLTHAFVRRLLMQRHQTGYLHQMALTFTRKATEEMKMRILSLLNDVSLPLGDERGERERDEFLRNGVQENDTQGCSAQGNGAQGNSARGSGAQENGTHGCSAQGNGVQWCGAQENGAQWSGARGNSAQGSGAQWNSAQENGVQGSGARGSGVLGSGARGNGALRCGDRAELRRRGAELRSAILHDYGRFSVYTIDSFFQRIVRSFLWEAGLPPSFSVELDTQRLLQEAIDQVVDEVATHEQNRKWIGAILSEQIQEGKRWNVQEAFSEVGKQVLDERFSSLGSNFANLLCDKEFLTSYIQELRTCEVGFRKQMERYATEVLSFLEKEGLCTTDFKGKSRSFMRYFDKIQERNYLPPPDNMRKALDDTSLWSSKSDPKATQIESILQPLSRLIEKCIDYYDTHAPLWFALRNTLKSLPQMGLAADVLRHVRNLLSEDHAVHLSQTLQLLGALSAHSDAPFILERMGCRYSDFLLDEFQDTSVLQWKVLLPLIHNGLAQGGVSLVVGDIKQSIYRWRNSDWRILSEGLHNDLHTYNPKDQFLLTNRRSRQLLVNRVGNIFEQLIESVYQDFITNLPSPLPPEEAARFEAIPQEIKKAYADVCQQIPPEKEGSGGYVAIYSIEPLKTQNEQDLEQVLERLPLPISAKEQVLERLPLLIMELQDRGFSASDIAILVRKNDEGQQVASTLMSYKERPEAHRYCFDVVSPDTLFINRSPEVQLIMAIFKRLVTPNDALNNRLITHLSAQLQTVCPDSLWSGALQYYALPEAFEEIVRTLQWTDRRTSFSYLQELHSQILTFSTAQNSSKRSTGHQAADTFSFVRWWSQNKEKITLKLERSGSAIEIITIHKSKGLQYPVVIIPFCNWELDYIPAQSPLLWVSTRPNDTHPNDPLPNNFHHNNLHSSDSRPNDTHPNDPHQNDHHPNDLHPNDRFAPLNRLPFIPQRYGSEMAQSLFTFDYYYEKMQRRIDQLNLFYVAATRAEDELHLFLPQPSRNSHNNLASILKQQLFGQEPPDQNPNNSSITLLPFGAPVHREQPPPTVEKATHPLERYASAPSTLRLHTRLSNSIPLNDSVPLSNSIPLNDSVPLSNSIPLNDSVPLSNSIPLNDSLPLSNSIPLNDSLPLSNSIPLNDSVPRKHGIILHQLLSLIYTQNDIEPAINELISSGVIPPTPTEYARYAQIIRDAIAQPQASEWFDGTWRVRTEASILLPASGGHTIRPDRVMEKDGRILIIDYKFGQPLPAHQHQMDEYITALTQMGVGHVEGYVWYIPSTAQATKP